MSEGAGAVHPIIFVAHGPPGGSRTFGAHLASRRTCSHSREPFRTWWAIERDQKQIESLKAKYREQAAALKHRSASAQQPHKKAVRELETDIQTYMPKPTRDPLERADAQSRYIEQQREKAQQTHHNRTRDGPEPGR